MATLYSTHCPSFLSSSSSSSSPSNPAYLHCINLSKRFLAAKVSLKSQTPLHQISVLTQQQEGGVAATVTPSENDAGHQRLKAELLSVTSSESEESQGEAIFEKDGNESSVSITVVGASGDLAKKKIFPALFALYYEGCLPKHFTICGYARSKMTDAELRNMVSKTLTCRIDKRENCSEKMEQFLERCFYHSGQYDSEDNFAALDKKLKEHEEQMKRIKKMRVDIEEKMN